MTNDTTASWIREHFGVVSEDRGSLELTLQLDLDRQQFPKTEFVTPPGLEGYSLRLVRTFADTIEFTRETPLGERSTRSPIPRGAESVTVKMLWSGAAILLQVRNAAMDDVEDEDSTTAETAPGAA
jgi:hypothetical protein